MTIQTQTVTGSGADTDRRPLLVRLISFNPEGYSAGLNFIAATVDQQFGGEVTVDQVHFDVADFKEGRVDVSFAIEEAIRDSPDIVGLSWYVWNHKMVQELARCIASMSPSTQLVVGGPETGTFETTELEKFPKNTILVFGEGEVTFCELTGALLRDGNLDTLPTGTARVTDETLVRGPRRKAAAPLAEIPSPLLTGHYREPSSSRLPSYSTTRGCIYRCSFCAWQDGLSERQFPIDRVFQELDLLSTRPYEMIWFTDTIFGHDEERALTILERLAGWDSKTRFGFELHSRFLTPALIDALHVLPLDFVAVGVQSLAPDVLRLTRRSPRVEQILDSVDSLYQRLENRSSIHLDLIFGLPNQTLEDCFESVDTLLTRFPEATLFCSMLQLIPGTAFERFRAEPGWTVLPAEGDYEVVGTPTLNGHGMSRIKNLVTGLHALFVARQTYGPRLALTAAQAEEVGSALHGTAFYRTPTDSRVSLFTAADLGSEALGLLMRYARVGASV
ncbi:radical SAM protein [Streptomyces sp. NPDC088270]|uniref:B12-binding domain-containing radical SAM protein n=1 Tax=Streptomyces sp. NPDC088270 TaxID=3160990 RepID=UPI0034198BDC